MYILYILCKNPSSDKLRLWSACMAMCRIYHLSGLLSMLENSQEGFCPP